MSDALSTENFAAMLSSADQPEQPLVEDSGPEEDQTAEVDAEPQADSDGEAPEQDAEQQEEAADEQDGQPEGPTDDAVIKWETANGEAFEVPVSELKNGYMRDSDYRQKTQTLAEERKAAAQQLQQQYQDIQAFAPELGALENLRAQVQQYQQLDWHAIRAQDPQRHSELFADYMLLKDQYGEAEKRVAVKRQTLEQMRQQSFAQATREAVEHLRRVIPNFGDATLKQLGEQGVKEGYTQGELANVADKRHFTVLWKAAQWDALQAKKPEVHNKVKALPPKAKPATSAPRPSKQEQVIKAAQSRRTFSTNEFAALLAATRK
ncbi:hypothetical protein WG922_21570 [Ramlibacter sp. AN1015]|uniref:hypothetical protein n=1 Tax=Ramlibacter sp. AN1015 TaxID=3133428 RepID=UPI0030C5E520